MRPTIDDGCREGCRPKTIFGIICGMETVEILSIHSRGTKDGVEFSPSSMPLSALEAVITTIPKIVMGASIQSSRRSEIREAMRISIEDGSINIGVVLSVAAAAMLNGTTFAEDMASLSVGRIADIKDGVRKDAVGALKSELVREGASSIGVSSQYANVNEFDMMQELGDAPLEESALVDSDSYVMALITDLGGKSKANVHLEIPGRGTIVAESVRQYLSELTENLLYKEVLAHVAYKVDVATGEWSKPRLISLDASKPRSFDVRMFEAAISKPTGWNSVVDPVAEIRRLRGADVAATA